MKPLPEHELAPAIADALESLNIAKEAVKAALASVQSDCEHRIVSEMPYSSIQPAHRICNHCRFIERGSHWSGGSLTWSKHDHSKSDLGNVAGRIVLPVNTDTFYKLRVLV